MSRTKPPVNRVEIRLGRQRTVNVAVQVHAHLRIGEGGLYIMLASSLERPEVENSFHARPAGPSLLSVDAGSRKVSAAALITAEDLKTRPCQ